ncbi:MAG: class I SAM-dependent methyltransferase [Gammaproteobacteria bacterium]|nr:class I SAM-dependent methyltransferase [Gammaproteobacteria bacterium]
MKFLLAFIILVIAAVLVRKLLRFKTLTPLLPRKYNFGKRRDTLREVLRLLDERGARVLLETGVARMGLEKSKGDGASTIVFGLWAKQNDAHLYSVDIDPEATQRAGQAVAEMGLSDNVTLVTSDSVAYLDDFTETVDFLYLDSYDYHKTDTAIQTASQDHHLKEIKAIEGCLHDKTVILIDDCDMPNGGKGKLVIEWLTGRGWKVHMSEYQVILVQST